MNKFQILTQTGGNAMAELETTANNFFKDIQLYIWIAIAVAIITNGILCVVGGEAGRERAKKAMPWTLIGCLLVLGGVSIANWITGNIAFSG